MVTAPSLLDLYVDAAVVAGCPKDQFEFFVRSGIVLQPRQLSFAAAARECDKPDGPTRIGYGGARGGGKSHSSVAILADDCTRCDGLKCLFLRKVLKGAKESFGDLRFKVLRGVPTEYKSAENQLVFANGSKIILGHFRNESDIDAYLGLEYDVICTEEATTLSASKRRAIRTCLRTSKPNWRPREYDTTNPGGIGHADFKKQYVVPYKAGKQTDTRFVPATVDDNRFVNEGYVKVLDALVGWQKEAWRYGDWDIAAGQFFSNWAEDFHVVSDTPYYPGCRVWCALDYGFTHYTSVGLYFETGDGDRYKLDEHGARKKLPEWHAARVVAMLERHGLTLSSLSGFVAGHDVFAQRGTERTIAQTYEELGIKLQRADIDRVNGAGNLLTLLGNPRPDPGESLIPPRFFVHERCARTVETIPAMVHDPHRPEDVLKVDCDEDGQGGDDFYDETRYGLMFERRAVVMDAGIPINEFFQDDDQFAFG